MAVKTKKSAGRSSRTGATTTKKKSTRSAALTAGGPVRTADGQFASSTIKSTRKQTGRPNSLTGQMNKGKGAVGASKPPKPVARPSGGSKPKGGKGGGC
jgi:hypothetical protein